MMYILLILFYTIITQQIILLYGAFIEENCFKRPSSKCLRVSTVLAEPYIQEVAGSNSTSDDALNSTAPSTNRVRLHGGSEPRHAEGFLVDYFSEISDLLGFGFSLRTSDDGKYGDVVDGKWNGVVADLINQKADVALAALTITDSRESVIDFTYDFETVEAVVVVGRARGKDAARVRCFDDLVRGDSVFRYGVRKDGALYKYFMRNNTNNQLFNKTSAYLTKYNLLLPESNTLGLARVQEDPDYAFIVESSAVKLALRRQPCDLVAIATGYYRRRYGMGVRLGSPLRKRINSAMSTLMDNGVYDRLVAKWWGVDECSRSARIFSSPVAVVVVALLLFFN